MPHFLCHDLDADKYYIFVDQNVTLAKGNEKNLDKDYTIYKLLTEIFDRMKI